MQSVLTKLDSTMAATNKIVDEQNRREIKILLASLNQTVAFSKILLTKPIDYWLLVKVERMYLIMLIKL